jgi:RNA polymerase sigma factor (TIGR02999 family)
MAIVNLATRSPQRGEESLINAVVNPLGRWDPSSSLPELHRTEARPAAENPESPAHMTDRPANEPAEEKRAAAELLPVLYEELRRLAASLTTKLPPGQTLQPTALVHEAYLRLVKNKDPGWEGRRHFFGAAARAMREILIEQARQKASFKHGGKARRIELSEGVGWIEPPSSDLLALDEGIQQLNAEDARLGEIVQLRYYTGLSIEETASVVGVSASTLKRDWRFARAWLARRLDQALP